MVVPLPHLTISDRMKPRLQERPEDHTAGKWDTLELRLQTCAF